MDLLTSFPDIADFYHRYWDKQPFLVRGWLPAEDQAQLASRSRLIALAQQPHVDSKLVAAPPVTSKDQTQGWTVQEGPFDEVLASDLERPRQSLLVQGVDWHHLPTARLWQQVAVAPLWLRDNIMASYSTHGGTVGPHMDSYHVFLLQGAGKRQWQVADAVQTDAELIDGLPLKILAEPFPGQKVVCEPGDLLYIPPGVCHHGISIEEAVTYSLGFLGPDATELWHSFSEYLDALAEPDDSRLKGRFRGAHLSPTDSGFRVSPATIDSIRSQMAAALEHPLFHDWLGEYFSSGPYPYLEAEGSNADFGDDELGGDADMDGDSRAGAFMDKVLAGSKGLSTVFPFKVAITSKEGGALSYQVAGLSVGLSVLEWQVIHALMRLEPVSKSQLAETIEPSRSIGDLWPLLLHLWEEGFLAFR